MNKFKLIEETIRLQLGHFSKDGALIVNTGSYTGRAPELRYVVRRPEVESTINWGKTNQPISPEFADSFFSRLEKKVSEGRPYTIQGHVGPFPIEVSSLSPWHALFASNMFRDYPVESVARLVGKAPRFQVFHDPFGKVSDLGLEFESEALGVLDPVNLKIGIIGTAYAGEIKKAAFSLANYQLPAMGILPMHASANCLSDGSRSCVLFGLSGTGKTTLSTSGDRAMIGDDEIVWTDTGLSNLEGGCYAKLIDLDPAKEPEIYRAANRFGSILENVGWDTETRSVDFASRVRAENTRGSYDISALDNVFDQRREASHPENIVFLVADAFGAMPAVARLDSRQAQYHFLSGYTARVAGTEIGVKEPQAVFSACFGAPFMPRPAEVYAKLLAEKAEKHGTIIWILNTGWTTGGYEKGSRFPIAVSRQLLRAIQSGDLARQPMNRHPVFGFEVPTRCPGVEDKWLAIPDGEPVLSLAERFRNNLPDYPVAGMA